MQRMCGPIDPGLYIDDAPSRAATDHFVKRAALVGYQHVCVMIEGHKAGFADLRWRGPQLAALRDLCAERNIERVATLWPTPSAAYMVELKETLPALLKALGTQRVELDMEGVNWTSKQLAGFRTMRAASMALLDALAAVGCQTFEVVTFLGRFGTVKTLLAASAPRCSRLVLMTYPRRHRNGREVPYSSPSGPRIVGTHLDALMQEIPPGIEIGSACSAWDQKWPGVAPFEAMRAARAEAIDRGVRVVRDWSSKWVIGEQANSYAEPALRRLYAPVSVRA